MREVFCGVISQGVAPYFFMEERTCSFFGHRQIDDGGKIYAAAAAEILRFINLGCRIFYFGGYSEFDDICYQIATKIKLERPELNIKRIYCVSQEKYLYKSVRYFKRENYDEITYLMPSFSGWYKSIYFRNCALIDQSDFILFYAESRSDSGAFKAYKYAKRKGGKQIVNLWISDERI